MFNIYWFIKYGRTQFSMHTRTRAIVGDTAGIWDHLRPDHTTTNCDPMESPCDPTTKGCARFIDDPWDAANPLTVEEQLLSITNNNIPP